MSPFMFLWEVEWVKTLWLHGVMCAVTLDEVMMCLIGPHSKYMEVGTYLCSC